MFASLPSEISAAMHLSALYLHAGIPTPAMYKDAHNDRAMNDTANLTHWLAAANAEITALEAMECWENMEILPLVVSSPKSRIFTKFQTR